MRATYNLFRPLVRLTLFTRENCGLCENAKLAVSRARTELDAAYHEVDIMHDGEKKWKDQYEFDVPVVSYSQPCDGSVVEANLV